MGLGKPPAERKQGPFPAATAQAGPAEGPGQATSGLVATRTTLASPKAVSQSFVSAGPRDREGYWGVLFWMKICQSHGPLCGWWVRWEVGTMERNLHSFLPRLLTSQPWLFPQCGCIPKPCSVLNQTVYLRPLGGSVRHMWQAQAVRLLGTKMLCVVLSNSG